MESWRRGKKILSCVKHTLKWVAVQPGGRCAEKGRSDSRKVESSSVCQHVQIILLAVPTDVPYRRDEQRCKPSSIEEVYARLRVQSISR